MKGVKILIDFIARITLFIVAFAFFSASMSDYGAYLMNGDKFFLLRTAFELSLAVFFGYLLLRLSSRSERDIESWH